MAIWKKNIDEVLVNSLSLKGAAQRYGIEISEVGDDFLTGKMPVDERSMQPIGILHGGASCVLAETLGSIGAHLCIGDPGKIAVGQNLNANHLRPVFGGFVFGTARAKHLGRTSQVWEVDIRDDSDKLVCFVILGAAIIDIPVKKDQPKS